MEDANARNDGKREPSINRVAEAARANGHCQLATPYLAPWFAHPAWGVLLCAAYPLFILTPLSAFAVLSPHSHLHNQTRRPCDGSRPIWPVLPRFPPQCPRLSICRRRRRDHAHHEHVKAHARPTRSPPKSAGCYSSTPTAKRRTLSFGVNWSRCNPTALPFSGRSMS
jgi:hypothetical protein